MSNPGFVVIPMNTASYEVSFNLGVEMCCKKALEHCFYSLMMQSLSLNSEAKRTDHMAEP
jgi:hypothetical protein